MAMAEELHHASLDAVLRPSVSVVDGVVIEHFRGIQYATIPGRFQRSIQKDSWGGAIIDCTSYGPRCPQNYVDIGHLLRIPEDVVDIRVKEEEDEFSCLNLHIAKPKVATTRLMPVLLWIHGGSQTVTFASAASGCCDPKRIVADSVKAGLPIIVVSINYRLNIFAFGDGAGERNLALRDQETAINWVKMHIIGFGGDPSEITVAGESAGAVYSHAHMFSDQGLKRGILMSGSLSLSPPLPIERGMAMIHKLSEYVHEKSGQTLRGAPAKLLLDALEANKIVSMWIQEEQNLLGWESRTEGVDDLLIGDVEYESVLWRNGIETMEALDIKKCFESNLAQSKAAKLCALYGILPSRPTSSRLGALDFINDVKFAMPTNDIAKRWRNGNARVYQYLVDQTNPWQSSSRAHHAIDLIFLFGGYNLCSNPEAEAVGKAMREKWIKFVNGLEPWDPRSRYTFGPYGKSHEIDDGEYAARRRVRHWSELESLDPVMMDRVIGALAVGKMSLHN